jgi:hypothetical protein
MAGLKIGILSMKLPMLGQQSNKFYFKQHALFGLAQGK